MSRNPALIFKYLYEVTKREKNGLVTLGAKTHNKEDLMGMIQDVYGGLSDYTGGGYIE